eukprot:6487994-Amphidinium_carterae.1
MHPSAGKLHLADKTHSARVTARHPSAGKQHVADLAHSVQLTAGASSSRQVFSGSGSETPTRPTTANDSHSDGTGVLVRKGKLNSVPPVMAGWRANEAPRRLSKSPEAVARIPTSLLEIPHEVKVAMASAPLCGLPLHDPKPRSTRSPPSAAHM